MQHNLRRTSFGPIQCWKQASAAERTSASVAKYRLVMQCQTPRQLPDPFNRCQLRAVWREEQQRQVPPVFAQQWPEHVGMVVLGVVQHDDDALATTSMTQ